MKIVIATYGSHGDTRPQLALSLGLTSRGHDVTVLGEQHGAELAAGLGVRYAVLPGDLQSLMATPVAQRSLRPGANRALGLAVFRELAVSLTDAWFDTLLEASRDADVVLYSGLVGYVGVSVADRLGLPAIGANPVPITPTSAFPTPFGPPRNLGGRLNRASHIVAGHTLWRAFAGPTQRTRRRHGLGRISQDWAGYDQVYGFSPTVLPRPVDWPAGHVVTGEWRLPVDQLDAPEPGLVEFIAAGEPPVYVGFGSMTVVDRAFWPRIITGLAGRRAVVSAGWSDLGDLPLPPTVYRTGPVSHEWLFPQMSAIVHHGGSGTTHAAARSGIPSIVVPFIADQEFWAARLRDLGVAGRALDRARLTPGDLDLALMATDSPRMRERTRAVALAMADEDGVREAAAQIEAIVAR